MAMQPESKIGLVGPVHCSFCGKSEDDVKLVVVADHTKETSPAICNECFVYVAEIMETLDEAD